MTGAPVPRRATIASATRIAALQAEVFGGEPWGDRFVTSLMHLPGTIAYVVEGDGVVDGYVLARALSGEAEIISIAVAAERQRRGVGAALLHCALAAATAAGARTIHLEVADDNVAARALYARAGFIESGRRARYYADGADALVLRRPLPGEAER